MRLVKVIGIVAALLLSISTSSNFFAHAQENMTITVDKESFSAGETVVITGRLENAEEGTPVAIEVRDADGQTLVVRTVSTDAEGNYRLEFKVPSSAKAGNLTIFTNAEVDGEKASSTKTVTVETSSPNSDPSGSNSQCIIATAAFGSELAPQVQFLRNFRDQHILATASGSNFMNVFNAWYYSFSPYVADYERGQSWLQQTVRVAIYPLLGILTAAEKAYAILPGEYGSLGAGVIASSLIGAVYLSPAAMTIRKIRNAKLNHFLLASILGGIIAATLGSLLVGNDSMLAVTTSLLVLSTMVITAVVSANYLLRGIRRIWRYRK